MKKFVSIVLFLFVSNLIFAQKQGAGAVISWDKTSYDFGSIKEEDGVVKYRFIFVNVGDEPLLLEKVKSTCGCTTSNYTKDTVMELYENFHLKFNNESDHYSNNNFSYSCLCSFR
jgi:hypothetical protein